MPIKFEPSQFYKYNHSHYEIWYFDTFCILMTCHSLSFSSATFKVLIFISELISRLPLSYCISRNVRRYSILQNMHKTFCCQLPIRNSKYFATHCTWLKFCLLAVMHNLNFELLLKILNIFYFSTLCKTRGACIWYETLHKYICFNFAFFLRHLDNMSW